MPTQSALLRHHACRWFSGRLWLVLGLMGMMTCSLRAGDAEVAGQVLQKRLFPEPLTWLGSQPPPAAQSAELLSDIGLFETSGINTGIKGLEQFLQAHPQSAWAPSLQVNLAEYYRQHGRYSLALAHWQAAWDLTKDSPEAGAQKIAVRTIAGWTRLLASLGEKDELKSLFAEVDARNLPLGIYGTKINETKEGLGIMNVKPGVSYRCGSFALGQLAVVLGLDKKNVSELFAVDSPDGGFHLSELLKLAQTNGLAVEAVRRPEGADLVVPSVVHWKLNHFAAITKKNGDMYQVVDPTFEHPVWMDAEAIEAESSGEFLVPAKQTPASWQQLTASECANIYGKGFPCTLDDLWDFLFGDCPSDDDSDDSSCDPPASNDGAGGGGGGPPPVPPPCPDCGMPQWTVSEPYISLWLKDAPLIYHQSSGKWMRLNLSYKSRGEAQNSAVGGFGDKWACNWIGMLQAQAAMPGVLNDCRAGGGHEVFSTVGMPSYKTSRSVDWEDEAPALVLPTGASNQYGSGTSDLLGNTNYLLTSRKDRYGRVLNNFRYQTIGTLTRMTNMLDLDGRTNTLYYGNSTFTNLITAVSDPYGHTAYFSYDNTGLLTNIVDVQGMSTYFQYDSSENITNMVTPYGTNSFQYFSGTDANGGLQRALIITEASGDHQVYAYQDDLPDGALGAPDDLGGSGTWQFYRNSLHWNRLQYGLLTSTGKANPLAMSAADYNNASLKHWLHISQASGGLENLSDTMDSSADAKDPAISTDTRPNCVNYTYYGESFPYTTDGSSLALKIVTTISSMGGWQDVNINYNTLGRPTNTLYYNRGLSAWTGYTNQYDSGGMILQTEIGPNKELTRGYGYDPVLANLLVSVTNAMGDVLRYTHDSTTLKVTSITFPGGLVRTNIYYASGPQKGFLQQQIDLGIRTNSFVYANGNLWIQTNELGLVTTNLYDNLSRLISTAYPDGSTISNVYNKLDIVATKDRLNQWTYYGYNAVRQLMAVTNVDGQVTTYDYCGCGAPDEIIRWNGSTPVVTTFSYSVNGLLTNALYPDGYQLNYAYDNQDRVSQVTDGAGNQLTLYYQMYGVKSLIQQALLGNQTILQQQIDQYGRVINSLDRNNITTTFSYDFLDRMTNRQFTGGSDVSGVESFSYNALGLTNYVDQLGHTNIYVRDKAGRLLDQTNANLEVQQFTYNPADEMLTLTDGKNQMTSWGYDSFGRVTNKVDALANVVLRYQYDADDRLTNRWSAAKGGTTYKYDPLGNLTNVVYPLSSNLVFHYDPLNRMTNMLDGLGSTTFGWTLGDQLASETGPWANDAVNYTYDNGRQRNSLNLSQPNSTPWTQTYGYDPVMRLTNVVSPAGIFGFNYNGSASDKVYETSIPSVHNYSFIWNSRDGLQRITTSQVSEYASEVNYLTFSYDPGSELTQQVFTAGNMINYTYDNIGQLKTAQGLESDNVTPRMQEQFGYAYDAAWNLNRRTNNALVQTFGVNSVNELSSATRAGTFTVAGDATEPRGGIYGYPPGVTNVTVSGTGLSSGAAILYADGTWARTNTTLANGANTYTAVGKDTYNRTDTDTHTLNLPASVSYSYDSNGNLLSDGTRNFAYDDENQLVSAWVASTWSNNFVYDGLLRRRIERDYSWSGSAWLKTNEVRYVYDGMVVMQERDTNNLPMVTYTRGNDLSGSLQGAGGIGGLLARTDNSLLNIGNPSAHAYYFYDQNGNVMGLVNTNGYLVAQYTYDPFGNILNMSGPLASANKYRFSSKEWNDNSGLYYYGYRFYDPNLQRWPNRDPLGDMGSLVYSIPSLAQDDESDGAGTPTGDEALHLFTEINQNLQTFGLNNPINSFDAFGLQCDDIPAGEPGGLNAETIEAADTRSAGEIAEAKLKRSTLDAIQNSKVFGNGVEGSRVIDVNKLKQALNPQQLQKAKQIAQDAVQDGKAMLEKATTDNQRQAAFNFLETQLNRARACKMALTP